MNVQRRARVLLGTLVEVGIAQPGPAGAESAFEAAYGEIAATQSAMSRFEPASDIGRFHALTTGGSLQVTASTAEVLQAAAWLHAESEGLFDVSLGSGPQGWRCEGDQLIRLDERTTLDLGGIAKGHAVDLAIDALRAMGCSAGWVNAGGDLRVFGDMELPVALRDEQQGGVRQFGHLRQGAFATSHFATSHFGPGARARQPASSAHVSVSAAHCLWADALTKIVALSGRAEHPLVGRLGAQAWLH